MPLPDYVQTATKKSKLPDYARRAVLDKFNAGELTGDKLEMFNELKERGTFDQLEQPGPIEPGGSISTLTGEPITEQEIMRGGKDISLSDTEPYVRPVLEGGGMVAGGTAGLSNPIPGGSVIGGGLGYAAAKQLVDMLYGKEQPKTVGEAVVKTGKDITTGVGMELGGKVIGKGVELAAKPIGSVIKQTLGATTGSGPGMIETALSGKPGFKAAMRGKITGNEIVDNTMDALQLLRDKKAARILL